MAIQPLKGHIHPFFQLNNQIHEEMDRPSCLTRFCRTITKIRKDYGRCAAVAATATKVAAVAYGLVVSCFLVKGSVYSFMEIHEEGMVQAWGDIGGWLTLPIVTYYSISRTLSYGFREAEYRTIPSLCKEWYTKASAKGQISAEDFYVQMTHILDTVAGQCLMNKTVVSRKLKALEIIRQLGLIKKNTSLDPNSELSLDLELEARYIEMEKERKRNGKNYLSRLKEGVNVTEPAFSNQSKVSRVVSGITLPICLLFNTACSAIGEPLLCFKLMVEKEDLAEYGHAGEWPDNFLTSLVIAYWLSNDLVAITDLKDTANLFQSQIDQLGRINSLAIHNRLCETGNSELQQIASGRTFNRSLFLNYFHSKRGDLQICEGKIDEIDGGKSLSIELTEV